MLATLLGGGKAVHSGLNNLAWYQKRKHQSRDECSPFFCVHAASVNLEQSRRGSGFINHPAVVDNCMQMGPAIGALASMTEDKSKALTRVVAGLAGFHGVKLPDRHQAFCASEMMPPGPDEEIYTSHWILGGNGEKALVIKDLKVPPSHRANPVKCLFIGHVSWAKSEAICMQSWCI